MRPVERWWFEKLRDGVLLTGHQRWQTQVVRELLQDDYATSMGKTRNLATATELGMHLSKLVPGLEDARKAVPGSSMRKWYWLFPPLADCRAHFDRLMRTKHSWPSEEGPDV
jgi:hypothetical protein